MFWRHLDLRARASGIRRRGARAPCHACPRHQLRHRFAARAGRAAAGRSGFARQRRALSRGFRPGGGRHGAARHRSAPALAAGEPEALRNARLYARRAAAARPLRSHAARRTRAGEQLRAAITAREVSSYSREKCYFHKDGRRIWVNVSLSAVRDAQGRATHIISIIQDITDRRKMGPLPRESEKRDPEPRKEGAGGSRRHPRQAPILNRQQKFDNTPGHTGATTSEETGWKNRALSNNHPHAHNTRDRREGSAGPRRGKNPGEKREAPPPGERKN